MQQSSFQRWDELYHAALGQAGYFTLAPAKRAGLSDQCLYHHLQTGRAHRVLRGVYRLHQFPHSEHEDLMALWLWSGHNGVFSHITALSLLQLSDALPKGIHMTLPSLWQKRRMKYPQGVTVHFSDLQKEERTWFDGVPITTVSRTLSDCQQAHLDDDLLEQAYREARERGLLPSAA